LSDIISLLQQRSFRVKMLYINFCCLLALVVDLAVLDGVWIKFFLGLVEITTLILGVGWVTDAKRNSEKKFLGMVIGILFLLLLVQSLTGERSYPKHQVENLLAMFFVVVAMSTQAGVGWGRWQNRQVSSILAVLAVCSLAHLSGILIGHHPAGFFDNPHFLALFNIAAINVAFYFFLSSSGSRRIVALAIIVISLIILSLIVSHIAWLALGCSLLVWLYLLFHGSYKKMTIIVVLSLAFFGVLGSTMINYNTALINNDIKGLVDVNKQMVDLFHLWNDERVIIWKDTLTMQMDSDLSQWLFGHGLGSFKDNFSNYSSFNQPGVGLFPIAFVFPHNFILEILFNSGVTGLLIMFSTFIVIIKCTLDSVVPGKRESILALGLFTAVFIQMFFTLPIFSRYSSIVLGMVAGYCLCNVFKTKKEFVN